ncbi:ATP-dependent DNA ligase [Streptomyces globisporus]|uniref:ATP-dependent DNA ligase n=1 Tax=Streptomyces globisporus TaxID=1908 RepID=UPI003F4D436F
MLATPGALPSAAVEDGWAFEVKQDGQRAMIYLPGDGTMLVRTRSGTDITSAYPELLPLVSALGARSAVLDGEIVALDDQGRSDFERLQQRMGLAGAPARAVRMAARVPAHLMLFDIVHLDGRLLTGLPYAERREVLEGLGLAGPAWSTPSAITGHGAEAWETAREAGLEGLIAKRLTSRYEPGARSKTWVKIKVHRLADGVIGVWVPGRGRLTGLPGAVLVGELERGPVATSGRARVPARCRTRARGFRCVPSHDRK